MTEKCYLNDSYTTTFTAHVQRCQKTDQGYAITLDRSYFYPEGGGQPADRGRIDDAFVDDVQLINDHVVHYCTAALPLKAAVQCQIDSGRRLDLMTQHSGQHLLSAVAWQLYQARTVGFHLTEDNMTVDFDIALSEEQLIHLTEQSNRLIRQNLALRRHYPDSSQLSDYPLRKTPPVSHNIRLIEIDGYDIVPCGGTHVAATGNIGLIHIISADSYKGGLRITFCCGERAARHVQRCQVLLNNLVAVVSTPAEQLAAAVVSLQEKYQTLDKRYQQLQSEQLRHTVQQVAQQYRQCRAGSLLSKVFNLDKASFKEVANRLLQMKPAVYLLRNDQPDASQLILADTRQTDQLNIREIFQSLAATYQLRGGGSAQRCQGSADLTALQAAFQQAEQLLISRLK